MPKNPSLTIPQGTLQGSIKKDFDGNDFLSFQGIPYAKPPIGPLRFKAPEAAEKWTGILDATKEGNRCYARDMVQRNIVGNEDCLFLNVYTKELPYEGGNRLCPVMFWIHGGAFLYGSGDTDFYDPAFLLTEDIVLVTINYRLGMLGFLNLEDPSLKAPGNLGFRDMILALKWVQNNIKHFRGDPQNVTIFGESAGAGSVHLLTLSPMSKGLFHKAIIQSGSAINPWVIGQKTGPLLRKALEMPDATEKELLDHLIGLPVEQILELQEKIGDNVSLKTFGAVVETNNCEPKFLQANPIDLINAGDFNKMPLMFGYTNAEAIIFELFESLAPAPVHHENNAPLHMGYKSEDAEWTSVPEQIRKFYYGDEQPSDENKPKKLDMVGDFLFVHGIQEAIRKQAARSTYPIYLYRMSLETSLNCFKIISKLTLPGTCHADDLGYLFKNILTPEIKAGSLEELSMKRFVKLWTNFARTGNPTPDITEPVLQVDWKPVENEQLHYLRIEETLVNGCDPDAERIKFWQKLYTESPIGHKYIL